MMNLRDIQKVIENAEILETRLEWLIHLMRENKGHVTDLDLGNTIKVKESVTQTLSSPLHYDTLDILHNNQRILRKTTELKIKKLELIQAKKEG